MIGQHVQAIGKTLAIRHKFLCLVIPVLLQPTIVNDDILVANISIALGDN